MRIRRYFFLITAIGFSTTAGSIAAADALCELIADETVSEMKAGAASWWTEDTARMAEMAAASACFKTRAMATTVHAVPQQEEAESGPKAETTDFMGLQMSPLSGPPSRKPYERKRD
jgi:hypothetical protein